MEQRHPQVLLECNTLVAKYNKLHEKSEKVENDQVKELAKKLKTLFTRVNNLSKQIKEKEEPHGILHRHSTDEEEDNKEKKKHVHFRQEV